MPRRAPLGWAVIVRPDRCVLAEGPIEQIGEMLEQALARIAPASAASGAGAGTRRDTMVIPCREQS